MTNIETERMNESNLSRVSRHQIIHYWSKRNILFTFNFDLQLVISNHNIWQSKVPNVISFNELFQYFIGHSIVSQLIFQVTEEMSFEYFASWRVDKQEIHGKVESLP